MEDLTAPIFDTTYIYPCIIPYICTLDPGDVEVYGLRTTGIEELDNSLDTTPTRVWLTIDQMVELYRDSHPVRIPDPNVCLDIYNSIIQYTRHWSNYLQSPSMNSAQIPVEDLMLLEEFASRLRPYAIDGQPIRPLNRLTSVLGDMFNFGESQVPTQHDMATYDLFKDLAARYRSRG